MQNDHFVFLLRVNKCTVIGTSKAATASLTKRKNQSYPVAALI
jgi:hypothetical protein